MKTNVTIRSIFFIALLVITTTGAARSEEAGCLTTHEACIQRADQLQTICGDPTSDCSKETRKAKLFCEDDFLKCSEGTQTEALKTY